MPAGGWLQKGPCCSHAPRARRPAPAKGDKGSCAVISPLRVPLRPALPQPSSLDSVSMCIYIFSAIHVPLLRDQFFESEMAFHGHTAMLRSSLPRSQQGLGQGTSWRCQRALITCCMLPSCWALTLHVPPNFPNNLEKPESVSSFYKGKQGERLSHSPKAAHGY